MNIPQLNFESEKAMAYQSNHGEIEEIKLPNEVASVILEVCKGYKTWAGLINEQGEHIINLKNPVPGSHFYTNMLLGNRMKFPYALQSTPKSVVDRLGCASFRSHAAVQVLATRWDFLPEENGFPANRQFYLVEKGKQIFYSADVVDCNVKEAYCTHGQNYTVITYKTNCGLSIKRTIFLLPQYEGLPLATEVQRIQITNESGRDRDLKVVLTGMLGTEATHALMEDVVYFTVIMQGKVYQDEKGDILAYSPSYYPCHTLENPFEVYGNPRWCTQYNNSITGENIGPTLSGTSTWMLITLIEVFGVDYGENELVINPILEEVQRALSYTVRFFDTYYKVTIDKLEGFYRVLDHDY